MLKKLSFAGTLILIFTISGCEYIAEPSESIEYDEQISGEVVPSGTPIEGQYIVVMNKKKIVLGKTSIEISSIAENILKDNSVLSYKIELIYTNAISGVTVKLSENEAAALRSDSRVAIVEQDRIISLARPPGKGKPPKTPEPQQIPWGIDRVGGFRDGSGKTAWIIDTGIDLKHADLNVDVGRSANFVPRGKDSPNDGHGHGTHVAGTIGAIDNDIDVVGVAANASLVAVRVLDNSGSGAYSWVIAGVDYVAANADSGDVANLSLGGPPSDALDMAVVNAAVDMGVLFSLAAGNSGADANNYSPARVDTSNVYTVSAIDDVDCMPFWSNWGNPPIEFSAPGVGVISTNKGGGTTSKSGTSMAAPHVAGLLLFGVINSDGSALCDPDGNPDAIAYK